MSVYEAFFCTPVQEANDNTERIKTALQKRPAEFVQFLRSTLVLSVVLAVARLPIVFLAVQYDGGCNCGKPLHVWLIVEAIIALAQVPLRSGLFAYFPHPSADKFLEKSMGTLHSRASVTSKNILIVHYVWTLIGLLWSVQVSCSCVLWTCTAFVVSANIIRALTTLIVFFGSVLRPTKVVEMKYSKGCADAHHGHSSCAVCLSEWDEGESIRVLSCKHAFCSGCANEWLKVRQVCPTCMRPA